MLIKKQNQIEDLQNLSKQYEQQAAERMVSVVESDDMYINRPVQVQQRRRYGADSYGRRR